MMFPRKIEIDPLEFCDFIKVKANVCRIDQMFAKRFIIDFMSKFVSFLKTEIRMFNVSNIKKHLTLNMRPWTGVNIYTLFYIYFRTAVLPCVTGNIHSLLLTFPACIKAHRKDVIDLQIRCICLRDNDVKVF